MEDFLQLLSKWTNFLFRHSFNGASVFFWAARGLYILR